MRRPDRRALAQWAGIAAILVLVGWVLLRVQLQADRVDALYDALTVEQQGVEDRGDTPVAPDPDELIEDPEAEGPQGPVGPTGPPGPGLSDPEVQAALVQYFADHPVGEEISDAELTAALASLLTEDPDILRDQVYAGLAGYLAEHPPAAGPTGPAGADGEDGAQGEPGPALTTEEIQAAIEAYIAEHPLPVCPEGTAPEAHTVITDAGPVDAVICADQPTE